MRNNIKRFRQEKGLLQRELGAIIGVHKSVIGQWECGTRNPSPAQQKDLAIALDVSPITRMFPDFVPNSPTALVQGMRSARDISTMGGLRQSADIKMGEKMMVKLSKITGEGGTYVPGTVVQITPNWFRVKIDKSGFSTCIHYQAFLTENDVRRA